MNMESSTPSDSQQSVSDDDRELLYEELPADWNETQWRIFFRIVDGRDAAQDSVSDICGIHTVDIDMYERKRTELSAVGSPQPETSNAGDWREGKTPDAWSDDQWRTFFRIVDKRNMPKKRGMIKTVCQEFGVKPEMYSNRLYRIGRSDGSVHSDPAPAMPAIEDATRVAAGNVVSGAAGAAEVTHPLENKPWAAAPTVTPSPATLEPVVAAPSNAIPDSPKTGEPALSYLTSIPPVVRPAVRPPEDEEKRRTSVLTAINLTGRHYASYEEACEGYADIMQKIVAPKMRQQVSRNALKNGILAALQEFNPNRNGNIQDFIFQKAPNAVVEAHRKEINPSINETNRKKYKRKLGDAFALGRSVFENRDFSCTAEWESVKKSIYDAFWVLCDSYDETKCADFWSWTKPQVERVVHMAMEEIETPPQSVASGMNKQQKTTDPEKLLGDKIQKILRIKHAQFTAEKKDAYVRWVRDTDANVQTYDEAVALVANTFLKDAIDIVIDFQRKHPTVPPEKIIHQTMHDLALGAAIYRDGGEKDIETFIMEGIHRGLNKLTNL